MRFIVFIVVISAMIPAVQGQDLAVFNDPGFVMRNSNSDIRNANPAETEKMVRFLKEYPAIHMSYEYDKGDIILMYYRIGVPFTEKLFKSKVHEELERNGFLMTFNPASPALRVHTSLQVKDEGREQSNRCIMRLTVQNGQGVDTTVVLFSRGRRFTNTPTAEVARSGLLMCYQNVMDLGYWWNLSRAEIPLRESQNVDYSPEELAGYLMHPGLPDTPENRVEGTWIDENSIVTYNADGTWVGKWDSGGRLSGTWKIRDKDAEEPMFDMRFNTSGQTLSYTVLGLLPSKMRWRGDDGNIWNLTKIRTGFQSSELESRVRWIANNPILGNLHRIYLDRALFDSVVPLSLMRDSLTSEKPSSDYWLGMLGIGYEGTGNTPFSLENGRSYLQRSAANGYAHAKYMLGGSYLNESTDFDTWRTGYDLLQQAAELDSKPARILLARTSPPPSEELMRRIEQKDASALLEIAHRLDCSDMTIPVPCLSSGFGHKRNYLQDDDQSKSQGSLKWYEDAWAASGESNALVRGQAGYGIWQHYHYNGIDSRKKRKEVQKVKEQALAALLDTAPQDMTGKIHYAIYSMNLIDNRGDGLYPPADIHRSLVQSWLVPAAEKGYVPAMVDSWNYFEGQKDFETAWHWASELMQQEYSPLPSSIANLYSKGYPSAIEPSAHSLLKPDKAKEIEWLEVCVNEGAKQEYFAAGCMEHLNKLGQEKSTGKIHRLDMNPVRIMAKMESLSSQSDKPLILLSWTLIEDETNAEMVHTTSVGWVALLANLDRAYESFNVRFLNLDYLFYREHAATLMQSMGVAGPLYHIARDRIKPLYEQDLRQRARKQTGPVKFVFNELVYSQVTNKYFEPMDPTILASKDGAFSGWKGKSPTIWVFENGEVTRFFNNKQLIDGLHYILSLTE